MAFSATGFTSITRIDTVVVPVVWRVNNGNAGFIYTGTTLTNNSVTRTITATPSEGNAETAQYTITVSSGVTFGNLGPGDVTISENTDTTNSFTGATLLSYLEPSSSDKSWSFMGSHDEAGTFFISVLVSSGL